MKTLNFPLWGNVRRTKGIIITMLMLITITSIAQNGINYKALIKDGSGNVVANQNITVQFTILQGVTNVYQETHTPNTDANGIIIINIGEGSIDSGVYADIDWASDEHFLNVQINTGGGLIDMGTTQFMAVPYALSAANITGLETLDEGNGNGWRLISKNPANYGNIGLDAVDISYSGSGSSTRGATGSRSTALGQNTTASGSFSVAMGLGTIASGENATAMGSFTTASANISTAMGDNTTASGENATALGKESLASGLNSTAIGNSTTASGMNTTAMGLGTKAEAMNVFAAGRYNIGGGTPVNWISTDKLFEVGNGFNDANRSNALTILKNGTITAPTFDIAEIIDNKALITKEYFDTNNTGSDSQTLSFNSSTNDLDITNGNTVNLSTLSSSGLEAIDEGNGYGWRLIGRDPNNYGNIGLNATDLSFNPNASSTFGATGDYAIAMGALITASGDRSTAMGNANMASGYSSTAFGANTIASGDYSTSIGNVTTASGIFSTAMGLDTKAEAYNATTFGRYNVGGGTPGSWIATDKLFEVGNGTGDLNRANAFTILKNGNTGIGTAIPNYTLSVNGTINLNEDIGTGIALRVNNSEAIWYDGTFFSWGFGGQANFFADNVGIGFSAPNVALDVNGSIEYTGTITDVSDIRLKENFMPIKNVLERLQKINAYSYNMINDETKKREYGVIAQELQKVFPEMVSVVDTEKGYLGVSYIQLIPIILEAIKEQNKKIEDLKLKLESYKSLEKRISALEANSN